MSGWRDSILAEFVPQVSKLTLVADPDNLLTEEHLAVELRQRGFDLIEFTDSIAFRYAYESRYRAIWDTGQHTDLVVILRFQSAELESLPYDLLNTGRKLSFNLGDLFPDLSYPVIQQLDSQYLDQVYLAQQKTKLNRLGDNATSDFLLLHVFGVACELIDTPKDLLLTLIRLHYANKQLPERLQNRMVEALRQKSAFQSWGLSEVVGSQTNFYQFLQERWPVYLERVAVKNQVKEFSAVQDFKVQGPENLPFDHPDIRVYIDNLFIENKLTPVESEVKPEAENAWALCGVLGKQAEGSDIRVTRLFDTIGNILSAAQVDDAYTAWRYPEWVGLSQKWAELSAEIYSATNHAKRSQFDEVGTTLNHLFAAWLLQHYPSLINQPPATPAMLHHVPRSMARRLEAGQKKLALILMDGLSLDQWVTLRESLRPDLADTVVTESATFAWVPSLTSVSRQALFAGNPPMYFPNSVNSTQAEERLWKLFWENQGISKSKVGYMKGMGDGDPSGTLESAFDLGALSVIGLVVDKVDRIMHGMELGAAGMHNQIRQWAETGYMSALLGFLLDKGFEIWLTADHGNIESIGQGRPAEGVIAETRGERVRIYPTTDLRQRVQRDFPFAHEWPNTGLPENYFPLVTVGKDAFISKDQMMVGHGGVSIEEVIVPLITIARHH